jgi:hypothetical protein
MGAAHREAVGPPPEAGLRGLPGDGGAGRPPGPACAGGHGVTCMHERFPRVRNAAPAAEDGAIFAAAACASALAFPEGR